MASRHSTNVQQRQEAFKFQLSVFLRPSQSTLVVSPPVGCYRPHGPSPFLMLLSPRKVYLAAGVQSCMSQWLSE